MISPFSPLLVAMILSRATFFFAILAAWRASNDASVPTASSSASCSDIIGCSLLDKFWAWTNGGSTLVPVLRQAKRECDRAETVRLGPKCSRPRDRDRRDAQSH